MGLHRTLCGLIAAGAATAGVLLAVHHPLWPGAVLAAFLGWVLLVVWRPDLWLFVVPAGLPLLNFSPWSGWLSFDEFDLLVLGVIAAGHARLAWRAVAPVGGESDRLPAIVVAAAGLFVAASVVALWRGFSDAGGFAFGWFQSYVEPMNSLRVFKPLLWALLTLPAMRAQIQASPERAMRRVGAGMAVGLAVVSLAVLWERIAYPGLVDFSSPYRAVGLFWEMHVGGGAIDAYLAMAAPFAAWALWSARTPLRWSGAAVLALLAGYACLTTFSRGVYLAVAAPLLLLGWLLWAPRLRAAPRLTVKNRREPSSGWRRTAGSGLAAALLFEVLAVTWTGSFLLERMAQSDRDLSSRIAHWTKGLGLLHDPSDRAFGIGLGRLPAHFARFVRGYEFPGAVRPGPETAGRHSVLLYGPATRRRSEGQYALTQRVPLLEGAAYRVEFDYRVHATAGVSLGVCELHLLYERKCQDAWVDIEPGNGSWRHLTVALKGPGLTVGHWFAPRIAVLEMSVPGAGTEAEFTNLQLRAGDAQSLLRNGDFSGQMAHWFPSAQGYFVPWHLDNLYLELLVEHGPLALAGFIALMAWALSRLIGGPCRGAALSPFLAASLSGALLVGLLSSVMDASRPAFLLFFLMGFSVLFCRSRAGKIPRDTATGDPTIVH